MPGMTGNADPHFLRTTFDDSPELYDRSRAVPPQSLFDDLITLARLEPGARLVEVGCGTGQATLALAERGYEIVGVELGESLASFTRRKLTPFPRVTIVTSSFEEWNPTGELFDAVVAFNSFHWIRAGTSATCPFASTDGTSPSVPTITSPCSPRRRGTEGSATPFVGRSSSVSTAESMLEPSKPSLRRWPRCCMSPSVSRRNLTSVRLQSFSKRLQPG